VSTFLENPAGWTVAQLVEQLRRIQDASDVQAAKLWANNVRVTELYRRAGEIVDPARRELERKLLEKIGARQAQAVTRWTQFKTAWKSAVSGATAFLRSAGVAAPTGLGALPIVPLAIAGAIVVAGGFVAAIAVYNANTGKMLATRDRVVAGVLSGEISPEDALRLMAAADAGLDRPPDPFGLAEALKQALPLVAIIAAVVLLPKLLPAPRRRAA